LALLMGASALKEPMYTCFGGRCWVYGGFGGFGSFRGLGFLELLRSFRGWNEGPGSEETGGGSIARGRRCLATGTRAHPANSRLLYMCPDIQL
jgi:hypothetical protein